MAKIAILLNSSWNIYNFRLPLLRRIAEQGHEIVAIAPRDDYTDRIPYPVHELAISSRSANPLRDFAVLMRMRRLFARLKPDIVLLYTVKPNVYGNIAARLTGTATISNIAGLGSVFINPRPLTRLVMLLYRIALHHPRRVFFQNKTDMRTFADQGLVPSAAAAYIPGSGIDIKQFAPRPKPQKGGAFTFLLIARMLWDKGIGEYAAAAKTLGNQGGSLRFQMLGPADADNPAALTGSDIERLIAGGAVEYLGPRDNVQDYIAAADCIVLPSYREGLSRVLLEAAAMAKPIVTTRVPGCQDVVTDGVNGYLCAPRDARDLAEKMQAMAALEEHRLAEMGTAGRQKVVAEFDQELVIQRYCQEIRSILEEAA